MGNLFILLITSLELFEFLIGEPPTLFVPF